MSYNYRREFNEARQSGNWSKAESLLGDLINLTETDDEEFEEQQRKLGEETALRMNRNDKLAKDMGKGIKII